MRIAIRYSLYLSRYYLPQPLFPIFLISVRKKRGMSPASLMKGLPRLT
jgi:hypothetical protein